MNENIRILLVEDDHDDVDLLKEALSDNDVVYEMEVIKDGGLVMSYIDGCTVWPDIIVLDFNLPRVHGRQLLRLIKAHEAAGKIPVLILTTSSAQEDIDYSYREGADKYLIKPTTVQGINAVVAAIIELAKKSGQ